MDRGDNRFYRTTDTNSEVERLTAKVKQLERENSEMSMKLAMIATGTYRGDVQEFAAHSNE